MTLMKPLPNAGLIGNQTPRLFTPELRPLSPETSLGFEAIDFVDEVLGVQLIPWQAELLKRMLELNEDGTFRFKTILVILPRQQGKSTLLAILSLYFMFTGERKLVLGTAQNLQIARESWTRAVEYAQSSEHTVNEIREIRRTNGEQMLRVSTGSRYQIAASSRSAGRGLSVDVLVMDEIREMRDWDAYNALTPTTTARPNSLIVGITNAGDMHSVVLNTLRANALSGDDPTLGLFEWSAPDGCELDDPDAWVVSNPSLGYTFRESVLKSALATSTPAGFRTERLSQQVESLDGAIDIQSWNDAADPGTTLEAHRDKIVAAVDVSIDGLHTSLIAAAQVGQRFRVEVIAAWNTPEEARRDLPGLLGKLKPMGVVWIPSGPGAVLGAEMRAVEAIELKGIEVAEACQSLSDLVSAGRIAHSGDPMLSTQVSQATKYNVGDGWRFARRGGVGNVDAVYALAAAIHVLRTHEFEKPLPKPMVV